jgi:hypothetical protein
MASCCNRPYLVLGQLPRALNRDQWAGPNAKVFLPFEGFVRADGATMNFLGSTIPQYGAGPVIGGTVKANTFSKYNCEPGTCLG